MNRVRTEKPELAAWIECWQAGVEEFNRRRYWHAHEQWERGWTRLPAPERARMQGFIQAAAAFHLIEKGRLAPARSLMRSALAKWALARRNGARARGRPRVEAPGLEKLLRELLALEESSLPARLAAAKPRAMLRQMAIRQDT